MEKSDKGMGESWDVIIEKVQAREEGLENVLEQRREGNGT